MFTDITTHPEPDFRETGRVECSPNGVKTWVPATLFAHPTFPVQRIDLLSPIAVHGVIKTIREEYVKLGMLSNLGLQAINMDPLGVGYDIDEDSIAVASLPTLTNDQVEEFIMKSLGCRSETYIHERSSLYPVRPARFFALEENINLLCAMFAGTIIRNLSFRGLKQPEIIYEHSELDYGAEFLASTTGWNLIGLPKKETEELGEQLFGAIKYAPILAMETNYFQEHYLKQITLAFLLAMYVKPRAIKVNMGRGIQRAVAGAKGTWSGVSWHLYEWVYTQFYLHSDTAWEDGWSREQCDTRNERLQAHQSAIWSTVDVLNNPLSDEDSDISI